MHILQYSNEYSVVNTCLNVVISMETQSMLAVLAEKTKTDGSSTAIVIYLYIAECLYIYT